MTRGRCGSLIHIRMTFAFTTPRRFNRRTRRIGMKIGLIIVVILLVLALILGSSYVGRRNHEAVQDYNTYISLFPSSLVAGIAGFTRNDAYFKTDEGARTAPKVNFDFNKSTTPTPAPATPAPAKP